MKHFFGFAALALAFSLALTAGLMAHAENDRPFAEAEINKVECHRQEARYNEFTKIVVTDEAAITVQQEKLRRPTDSQLAEKQAEAQLDMMISKYRLDLADQDDAFAKSRERCSPQD